MDLLLIRHAEAEPSGPDCTDFERRLTARGSERFRETAAGLAVLGIEVDLVLHSPLQRAAETARLIDGSAEVFKALAEPPSVALAASLGERDATCIALVGHEPWMGDLCSLFLTGGPHAASGMAFRKGGVAWLRGQPRFGGMSLVAFLPPTVTRRLG